MGAMQIFPEKPQTFLLPGPAGQLEVMTARPTANAKPVVAVICHPDPRQEGTMHNKVVTTMAKAFDALGLATVRFNFRGIGNSDGEYGNVAGEQDDLRAVIEWVRQALPDHTLWLAGFSFGSYIAASVANEREDVLQLVTIAPPVHKYPYDQLQQMRCPWLIVQGDQDDVVPPAAVFRWAEHPPAPVMMHVMTDVGHFFHGRLIDLRELLKAELAVRLADV